MRTQEKRYLRKRELAARYSTVSRTIDRWVEAGRLPKPVRIGTIPLWDLDEVEARERQAMKGRDHA